MTESSTNQNLGRSCPAACADHSTACCIRWKSLPANFEEPKVVVKKTSYPQKISAMTDFLLHPKNSNSSVFMSVISDGLWNCSLTDDNMLFTPETTLSGICRPFLKAFSVGFVTQTTTCATLTRRDGMQSAASRLVSSVCTNHGGVEFEPACILDLRGKRFLKGLAQPFSAFAQWAEWGLSVSTTVEKKF